MHHAKLLLHLYSVTCLLVLVTCQGSTLTAGSTMYSNATLISPGGVFEVGFTSGVRPNLSTLAIWYANAGKTVVWVAPDRTLAVNSNQASLTLTALGDLQVHNNSGASPNLVWSAGTANVSSMSNHLISVCMKRRNIELSADAI